MLRNFLRFVTCVLATITKVGANPAAEMECQCENNAETACTGWFQSGSNVQMGAYAVVGYLLYRFSQSRADVLATLVGFAACLLPSFYAMSKSALPALIRWPIRFFCYITGLSALWGWVSRLVRTVRGIKHLLKQLSRLGQFLVAPSGDGSKINDTSERPELRLILLGPGGAGRAFVVDALLGDSKMRQSMDLAKQSTKWSRFIDGRKITVIDTPDILGPSIGNTRRAREALRSLQLTSPGPHAFLLVLQAPGSNMSVHQDLTQAIQGTLELFGEGATGFIIPVLTHADSMGRTQTVDKAMEAESEELKKALSLCGQTPELVNSRPNAPPEALTDLCRTLVERATETKECRGHFDHEMHSREDYLREKLLDDMSVELATKLGHV